MDSNEQIVLDNKTLMKLAIAVATAIKLSERGEAISPLVKKVLDTLEQIDAL